MAIVNLSNSLNQNAMPNNTLRYNYLMKLADQALPHPNSQKTILDSQGNITDSYNGQIASFTVSVSMSGLCPTLASYYKGSNNDTRAVNRKPILETIARMIHADEGAPLNELRQIGNAEQLLRKAIEWGNNNDLAKALRQEVIDCAIALKQVVRTYNLV